MDGELRSILLGTIGLDAAFVVALFVSLSHPLRGERALAATRPALVTIAIQALHFGEEFMTGFPERFPALLALPRWSATFFITFNVAWILTWAACAFALPRMPRFAAVPLWFLAFAAITNGIAHPLASLAAGGYFPGLVTAPVLGLAGLWLARRLFASADATDGVTERVERAKSA